MLKTMTNKRAAFNFWQTLAIGSVVAWVFFFANEEIAKAVTGKEPVNHLQLEEIGFRDGYFYQLMTTTEREMRQADWSADIWDGPKFVCGDGGNGTYQQRNQPVLMLPDDWTGDDCSKLINGREYQAKASWEYWDAEGNRYEITASFDFTYSEPKT